MWKYIKSNIYKCSFRSYLSIGQIFSLFLVLPLLLRSTFTFLCLIKLPIKYPQSHLTFFQVPQTSRHDHRPPCGSLNADPGSPLLLRHEHQVHPRHRLLQPLCRPLLTTSQELHDKDCWRRCISGEWTKLERLKAITEIVGECGVTSGEFLWWNKTGHRKSKIRAHTLVVHAGDVGAVFACVGSLQAVFGFLSPLYNKLYAAVRQIFCGVVDT